MRHATYLALVGQGPSILDLLDQQGGQDFAFDPPKLGVITRPADLL
jgi:hypothetical protein